MIGKVIKGRYKIIDEIGRGSVATAYLARDTTSNRVVILKYIHTEHVAESRFSQRFQPKARLLDMLSSPQAAKVLDYGEEDGRPFVVSEYVQGRTLDQVLKEEGPLDVRRTLEIAKQIALGLVDAHAKSIIHLDLRPPNVMLSPEDHVKVLDFGIAQATELSALAAAGTLGKPHYLSPEQVTAERVDARSDIYGLGVIVFELLTGQLPYDAPSAAEIVQAHLREPIPSLHQLDANIPPEVDDLVTRCLAKKPKDRYQSAVEFLEAIDQTLRNIAVRQEASPGIHADLAGQTLGAYRIIEQIGRGGMAVVYKAYEPGLDRYVAIKVLPQYFAHDPDFAARFEREAKAIAQLNHPNILSIFGSGQDAGLSYIVMRYVEAGTLRAKLGEPLPLKTIIEILSQVGKALDYAHERGIIHRDVKPSNVLMAEDNWALLCDFGLARMMESSVRLTKSGVGIGTPAYMSPEQGRGLTVDARSDVYSLGVVLYEMLTGQVPYTAETPMAVVLQHITAPLPMPRLVNPDLPAAVERVILKALAKDPDHRYQSAGEMMAALEAVMAEAPAAERPAPVEPAPIMAPPVPLAAPLAKEGHPPAWVWGVAGLFALLIVVGLVLLATRGSEPAPTPEATNALAAASTLPAVATVTEAPAATGTPVPTPTLAAVGTDTPVATEAAVLAPSPLPGLDVRMRLRLTTTSDWAQLTVLSGDEIVNPNTIESGGVTIQADMEGRVIRLLQELERGEAGHTMFVVQDLTLSEVAEEEHLKFRAEKGCLGEMTAEVYSLATGVPVLVARFVTKECKDGELFDVSAAILLTESPTPLSATVATQIWEQDGATMVYVPAGSFSMGSAESDPGFGPNEVPRHPVHLNAFWIDQTEVTNAQYRRCVDDGACEPPRSAESFTRDVYYGDPQFDDYPVLKVTWLQADAYCRWTGKRLPTEAEWEKAARGTDRRTYPWGNAFDGERLNFCDTNCNNIDIREGDWDDGYADTAPVGSYPLGASPYGALDMAGNAREWVADWFSPYSDDPLPEANPIGPLAGESRVDRGGSAGDGSWASRVTYRGVDDPSTAYVDIGFRCAYSEVAPSPP